MSTHVVTNCMLTYTVIKFHNLSMSAQETAMHACTYYGTSLFEVQTLKQTVDLSHIGWPNQMTWWCAVSKRRTKCPMHCNVLFLLSGHERILNTELIRARWFGFQNLMSKMQVGSLIQFFTWIHSEPFHYMTSHLDVFWEILEVWVV